MWLSVVTSALVISFTTYCILRFKWRKYYQFSAQLSGPEDYPLIGSAHIFFRKSSHERFQFLIELSKTMKNKSLRAWVGPVLGFATINPDDVKVILNSENCLNRSFIGGFFNLDLGLLFSKPDIWKTHRRLLNPSLSLQIIKKYVPVFNEKANILCDKLKDHLGQDQFDFYTYANRCAVDMISSTTLGKLSDFQNETAECDKIIEALDLYKKMVTDRAFAVWDHSQLFYRLTGKLGKFLSVQKRTFCYSRKVLAEKKMETVKKDEDDEYDDNYIKKPKIFIDLIVDLSKRYPTVFTDQAILDEVDTIFTAGFDTTTLAIAHTMLLLAMHPEIQDRVAEEVKTLFGDTGDIDDIELIAELDYLDMVIKESMRHFPLVPISVRMSAADVPLASRNLVIPTKVLILVPIFTMHRDPDYWGPDAKRFNPDNFLKENIQKRHPCSYIPFGYGLRNCIGMKYAMVSIKIILANLLRKYKFSTTYTMDTISLKFDVVLKLNHEHSVSIELR